MRKSYTRLPSTKTPTETVQFVSAPLTTDDAEVIAKEGRHKMKTYGCSRAIVIYHWRSYIVERAEHIIERAEHDNGPATLHVFNDINQLVAVVSDDDNVSKD